MALYVVATPIGNPDDLSPHAREILTSAQLVIGEEFRETSTLLKSIGATQKPMELLNEHSTHEDLSALLEKCRALEVALVSDCGTPGFCDPGAELVALCRSQNIKVKSVSGPSSLMTFLSVCGARLNQFLFLGFLPAKRELREPALKQLTREARPMILMDTPYRLSRLLEELAELLPNRMATIGMNLSRENETVIYSNLTDLAKRLHDKKEEFILLIHSGGDEVSLPRKTSRKK